MKRQTSFSLFIFLFRFLLTCSMYLIFFIYISIHSFFFVCTFLFFFTRLFLPREHLMASVFIHKINIYDNSATSTRGSRRVGIGGVVTSAHGSTYIQICYKYVTTLISYTVLYQPSPVFFLVYLCSFMVISSPYIYFLNIILSLFRIFL